MNYIFEEDSEIDLLNNQSRPKSVFETQHSFKAGLNAYLPVQHFLNFDQSHNYSDLQEPERMPVETTKQMIKMKNRLKAKRFRQKKKDQKELEQQNAQLKQSKTFCGRCQTKIQKQKSTVILQQHQHLQMQFQPPKMNTQKAFNGKIWIALGIIMLVIGVNINGFNKQPIQINLNNSFINKVQKQIQSQSPNIKIPFSMKTKQSILKDSEGKSKLIQKNQVLIIEGGLDSTLYQTETLQIKKDFIFKLHGQINQIGNYL